MAATVGVVKSRLTVVVVDVSGIIQLKFQQSFEYIIVPQILFIVRVLDISADTYSAKLCKGLCPSLCNDKCRGKGQG